MKPLDFRNATFAHLRATVLQGDRARVLEAWVQHGPGTTREVAAKAGIDILTFRPRTTELCQAGFLDTTNDAGREGVYRVLTRPEHAAWFAAQRRAATENQMQLI